MADNRIDQHCDVGEEIAKALNLAGYKLPQEPQQVPTCICGHRKSRHNYGQNTKCSIQGCSCNKFQELQQAVCQCGHSVAEHFEGGGDVTYCKHKDGFYICPCIRFVPQESQQVICPNAIDCNLCQKFDDCDKDKNPVECKYYVPVPPNELLTDEEIESLPCDLTSPYDDPEDNHEEWLEERRIVAKAQLSKCHQSEAARIPNYAQLKNRDEVNEVTIFQQARIIEQLEARIKELEAKLDGDCLQCAKDLLKNTMDVDLTISKGGEWSNTSKGSGKTYGLICPEYWSYIKGQSPEGEK